MSKDASACIREFRRIYNHFSKALPNAGAKCINGFPHNCCARALSACVVSSWTRDNNNDNEEKWIIGISCNSGFQPTGRATPLDCTKKRTRDIASVLAYNE